MIEVLAHVTMTGSRIGSTTRMHGRCALSLLMGFQEVWDFDRNHADEPKDTA